MNRKPEQLQPPLTYFSLIHVKEKGKVKEETQVSKEPGVDAVVISWERLFLSGVVLLLEKKIFCLYAVQWDGMSQLNHEVIGMLGGSPWAIGWWGAVFQHETGGFCRTWRLWGRLAFSVVLGVMVRSGQRTRHSRGRQLWYRDIGGDGGQPGSSVVLVASRGR